MPDPKFLGEFEVDLKDTKYADYTPADWAVECIVRFGGIDGAHHKDWTMDQVVRILKGTPVLVKMAKWDNGHEELRTWLDEPSEDYLKLVKEIEEEGYEWSEGIAP